MDTLSPRSWNRTFKQEVKLWYLTFPTELSEQWTLCINSASSVWKAATYSTSQEKTKFPQTQKSNWKLEREAGAYKPLVQICDIYLFVSWCGAEILSYWWLLGRTKREREGTERKLSICKRKKQPCQYYHRHHYHYLSVDWYVGSTSSLSVMYY